MYSVTSVLVLNLQHSQPTCDIILEKGRLIVNERRKKVKTPIWTLFMVSMEEKKMFRYGELIEVPALIILFLRVA